MRILLLFNHGNVIGGGEISFIRYINHLSSTRKDIDIRVFVPQEAQNSLIKFLKLDEEKIISFKLPSFKSNPRDIVFTTLQMHRIIKNFKPQIAHANGSRIALYINLSKIFTETKTIWHVRISQKDLIDPLLMFLSDGIIANSQKTLKTRFRTTKKIRVIYNGFDINEIKEKVKKPPEKSQEIVISSAGRLEPGKGFEYLLNFTEILSQKENIKVVLAGEGPMKKILKSIPKNQKILFPGYMNIEEILGMSHIICFPSLVDSFGNLVVESMIAGKPCMVSKYCGASEIYPIKELIFDPKIYEEFKKSFTFAKDNIDNSQVKETLQREAKRYSIQEHCQNTLKFYNDILIKSK